MPVRSHPARSAAVVLLIVLLVLGGWFGAKAYQVYAGLHDITSVKVPTVRGEKRVVIPPIDRYHRINILLLGSDNDQKKEEAAPLTQSMIVVTIDPLHDRVGLLSIPRDFWVRIPDHGWAKLDLAFKYGYQSGFRGEPRGFRGGVALARFTIEKLFNIPIDYYAWVGLQGFSNVIDTFGGVTLDVQHPILDDSYPNDIQSPDPYGERRLFIPPGWQHMNGSQTLEYVRSRHGDRIGDFGRSARQQQALLALRKKLTAMNVIPRLPDLVSELKNSIRTDLSLQQLYQLDELSHAIPRRSITRLVLSAPTYCAYAYVDYQDALTPYWNKILPAVHSLFSPLPRAPRTAGRSSSRATPTPTSGPTPTPRPAAPPTPAPSALHTLPGDLLFVEAGNMYRLRRSGTIEQLTWSGDAAMPAVSPDGKEAAFVRFTTGLHRFDKYASDIWIMTLSNHRQHIITRDESAVPANNIWAVWPSWLGGNEILYSSDRQWTSQAPSDARPTDLAIWEMGVNGVNPIQLTSPAWGAGGDVDPQARPGSSQYAYVAWNYLPNNQPYSQLMLRAPGGAPAALTPVGWQVLQPAWNPSGTKISFLRALGPGGIDQLIVADVDGSRLVHARVLATGELAQPAFTPDGREVSYLRVNGDGFTMDIERVGGGGMRVIPVLPSDVDAKSRPVWIPGS
ncbi:MAG TPA: LCP family protein [Chloroflexota bacterium]|nr:LCP family protein [Chloroflexota bacterium]